MKKQYPYGADTVTSTDGLGNAVSYRVNVTEQQQQNMDRAMDLGRQSQRHYPNEDAHFLAGLVIGLCLGLLLGAAIVAFAVWASA